MALPSDRSVLTRDAIMAAAREVIATSGLEALSLRRLATGLGVTAPALYAHVTDKEDLLRALATAEFDVLLARFAAVDEADPVARIRAHSRAYVAHARASPELFQVMFLFPPDLGAADLPEGMELPGATQAFSAAFGAVEEAAGSGALAIDDPLLAALTLWSAMHGVATVLQLGLDLPAEVEEALIDEVTDRLLAGYRPAG
ncbi:TetR/AcrR family transcriptional regulator [soil metagenome]